MNWLVYDYNLLPSKSGYKRLSSTPKETGQNIAHEQLLSPEITIDQAGYVYIFLSNEETTPLDVYFDDFKVKHTKSPVVQMDDYYPFGLTFNSYQRENSVENRYLYNQGTGEKKFNTERIFDLGLNIDLTKYRAYDPAIGRWWQVDPLADDEALVSHTPYNYSFNNPILYNDPEGDCPWCIGALLGAAVEYGTQVTTNFVNGDGWRDAMFNNVDFADVAVSGAEGALTGGASAGRKLLVNVVTEVAKASIDVSGNGRTDVAGTEGSSKTVKSVVTEATVSVVANKAGEKGGKGLVDNSNTKAVKAATSNLNAASKNLQKSINTTANSNMNSKANTTTTAYKAYSKAQTNMQKTKAFNQTVGKVNGNVVKGTADIATGTVGSTAADQLNKKKN